MKERQTDRQTDRQTMATERKPVRELFGTWRSEWSPIHLPIPELSGAYLWQVLRLSEHRNLAM